MDFKAELSPEAKCHFKENLPWELKYLAWDEAYATYHAHCSLSDASPREVCEWCEYRANRFWPNYLKQVSLQVEDRNREQKYE